ncbi:hypothetical protein C2I18_19720 [Paenibacillus sp. PK3_47]|uniref:hypothetical protein n=1 Tax=Paenibacillus sp. PK3_47 TaxID=2072642 RepID=UPI00201DC804|nr:hypothetical protein [Paenibacillus sp. PK3_47]UQZ35550.1 hypothetical protein C2I18_19720 [Paenibacillus sp. PK3_47]
MITRRIYRGIWKTGQDGAGLQVLKEDRTAQQLVKEGALMTAAAFSWRDNVFLYYECVDRELEPEAVAGAAAPYLIDWPGEQAARKWISMIDVFHFNEPANVEHWLRKDPVERRGGRVAFLKREMAASYIYYHYQLQEERAFHGGKYDIIAMHENLLFGYQEFPGVTEEPVVPGRLSSKGTPVPWSDSRMDLHFQPWEDGYLYFKPVEQIYAYYTGLQ